MRGMRINLGCGNDVKPGYLNVDFRQTAHEVLNVDLSRFPWPWADDSAEEILMLDFLEHFGFGQTDTLLSEVWRVLAVDGFVDIQVPDFDQLARAVIGMAAYHCNSCGHLIERPDGGKCPACSTALEKIAREAIRRLYGGQDYIGNYHNTSFTKKLLEGYLSANGFHRFQYLEQDHQARNWNFKVRAFKKGDLW